MKTQIHRHLFVVQLEFIVYGLNTLIRLSHIKLIFINFAEVFPYLVELLFGEVDLELDACFVEVDEFDLARFILILVDQLSIYELPLVGQLIGYADLSCVKYLSLLLASSNRSLWSSYWSLWS